MVHGLAPRGPALHAASGAAGGVAMGLYLAVGSWLDGRGPHTPFLIIGRTLDPARLPFELTSGMVVAVGILLHLATAVFWALRYRELVQSLPPIARRLRWALPMALLWGTAVWLLMGLIVGPTLNPKMRVEYPLQYYLAHLVYACVTAVVVVWIGRATDRNRARPSPLPAERPVTR